jgi:hypothetical protein
MMYLGIDPGASSGLAIITAPDNVIAISCKDNIKKAYKILSNLKSNEVIIGIEAVHAIYGSSASSTFVFGMNKGRWIGILEYLGLPYQEINIQDWQNTMTDSPERPSKKGLLPKEIAKAKKLHKETLKAESYRSATLAFPSCRITSHDCADAINIARYLKYCHEGNKKECL